MSVSKHLARRLRDVFLEGRWIANTNYQAEIQAVDWHLASKRVGELNCIARLVFHIDYYLKGLIEAAQTGRLEIRDAYSFDMPAIESEHDWESLRNRLLGNAQGFIQLVESIPEEQWQQPFIDPRYGSWLINIEAVIEHSYYHLGQIVLLRKMHGRQD